VAKTHHVERSTQDIFICSFEHLSRLRVAHERANSHVSCHNRSTAAKVADCKVLHSRKGHEK
jgi:hypothetical protein